MKRMFLATILGVISVAPHFGQQTEAERIKQERERHEIEQRRRDFNAKIERGRQSEEETFRARFPRPTKEQKERIRAQEAETELRIKEINEKLSPPAKYYSEYAEFLKGKDTGIARMISDQDCDKGLIVDVAKLERCRDTPEIAGAGSLYSFRLQAIPENFKWGILGYFSMADMHFTGGRLMVGNQNTQDIIVDVQQTDITSLDKKSEAVKFLLDFEPAVKKNKFNLQRREIEKGIAANGFSYSSSVVVNPGNSYILRSIAYHRGYKTFWNTDTIVAFKIVAQEVDGSIVFIWRKLREKDAPELYH